MRANTYLLLLALLATALLTGLPRDAQAQFKTGFTSLGFSNAINGVETDLDGLVAVLEAHTELAGETSKAGGLLFVYGIGYRDANGALKTAGLTVSNPVLMVPGGPTFVELGGGPLASLWQAYTDPLAGYDDPVFNYDDPVFNYDDPVFNFKPIVDYEDPAQGLAEIWGQGGSFIVNNDPDAFGLVLFSMPDPSASGGADLQHSAAIVPFSARENDGLRIVQTPAQPEALASSFEVQPYNTPDGFELGAYPNPFNPTTQIAYAVPEGAHVRLAVYDLLGREVALLVDRRQAAGRYEVTFEASHLPSGVYLYRIEAGAFAKTGRMTLAK